MREARCIFVAVGLVVISLSVARATEPGEGETRKALAVPKAAEPSALPEARKDHLEVPRTASRPTQVPEVDPEKRAAHSQQLEAKRKMLDALQAEVDRLRDLTGQQSQVLINVRLFELSRTKLRRLGVDFVSSHDRQPHQSGMFFNCYLDERDAKVMLSFFDALCHNDVCKVLAEPSLIATSGQRAEFRLGSEFSVPVPGSNMDNEGNLAVEHKFVGTHVDALPVVMGDGKIRLEIRARVSFSDESRQVKIGETEVPAMAIREMNTGVELKSGQTCILGGLAQMVQPKTEAGAEPQPPEERQFVVVVTAEIVSPEHVARRNERAETQKE